MCFTASGLLEHTAFIDLQEKRILLYRYIDRVVGVRIFMSEKLTSQMIREGGCGHAYSPPAPLTACVDFPLITWEGIGSLSSMQG